MNHTRGATMGKDTDVSKIGWRFFSGFCGALLAAASALSLQFWLTETNWWVVGGCAAFGFVFAWFLGEEAIEILKSVWWWS